MAGKEKAPGKSREVKPPIVRQCSCPNPVQDELHGKNMRLWNHASKKGEKPKRFRCTVCCKEQEF